MNSEIDDFLDHVDEWKFALHDKLKGLSSAQRKSFWSKIHKQALQDGLPEIGTIKPAKRPAKKFRRTA